MTFAEISVNITLSATFAVLCVYFYLYMQYREQYIGMWMISSVLHLTRLAFFSVPLNEFAMVSAIAYQLFLISSGLFLIYGTNSFLNRTTSRNWLYSAVLFTALGVAATIADLSFSVKALPVCLQIGSVYIWTGVLFLRQLDIPGWGRYITGFSYILLGLHIFDLPFLFEVQWFAPWGFLIDSVFRFMVAVGTLIVYFEKTRSDLAEKEQSYRLLADNALDVIYRYKFTPVPGFEYISPSVKKLTGYAPEDFYAGSQDIIYSIVHPNDHPLVEMLVNHPETANEAQMLRLIHKDLSIVWIEQRATLITDQTGELIGFEGIIRDISARKALEQDVSRLDRLNAVGQMAANVAHEIRNPLTTIHGYLQMFSKKQEFSRYKEQIQLLLDELDRTNLIIKEYLALSQNKLVDLKLIHLNHIIDSLFPLIEAHATASNKDIRLSLGEIPQVYLDANEIRQLILNLVRNGLEAMDSGGVLSIETCYDGRNRELVLAVRDQGRGIPLHILDKLGQPFITTKEQGTGLGLAVCYRIATRHQARIYVDTGDTGTTFFIRFKSPNVA